MTAQKYTAILQVNVPIDASTTGTLLPGQTYSRRAKAVKKLSCTAGTLWITLEGEGKDYILEAGASLELGRPGKLVVSALPRGSFSLV